MRLFIIIIGFTLWELWICIMQSITLFDMLNFAISLKGDYHYEQLLSFSAEPVFYHSAARCGGRAHSLSDAEGQRSGIIYPVAAVYLLCRHAHLPGWFRYYDALYHPVCNPGKRNFISGRSHPETGYNRTLPLFPQPDVCRRNADAHRGSRLLSSN